MGRKAREGLYVFYVRLPGRIKEVGPSLGKGKDEARGKRMQWGEGKGKERVS